MWVGTLEAPGKAEIRKGGRIHNLRPPIDSPTIRKIAITPTILPRTPRTPGLRVVGGNRLFTIPIGAYTGKHLETQEMASNGRDTEFC